MAQPFYPSNALPTWGYGPAAGGVSAVVRRGGSIKGVFLVTPVKMLPRSPVTGIPYTPVEILPPSTPETSSPTNPTNPPVPLSPPVNVLPLPPGVPVEEVLNDPTVPAVLPPEPTDPVTSYVYADLLAFRSIARSVVVFEDVPPPIIVTVCALPFHMLTGVLSVLNTIPANVPMVVDVMTRVFYMQAGGVTVLNSAPPVSNGCLSYIYVRDSGGVAYPHEFIGAPGRPWVPRLPTSPIELWDGARTFSFDYLPDC